MCLVCLSLCDSVGEVVMERWLGDGGGGGEGWPEGEVAGINKGRLEGQIAKGV